MKQTTQNYFKKLLLMSGALLALVACGKSNSDSSNNNAGVSYASCVVGQAVPAGYLCINNQLIPTGASTGSLLNNAEFNASYMNGSLSISQAGGSTGLVNLTDPKAIIYYTGPITVTGTMTVDSSLCTAGLYQVIAGSYSITGTGMMSSGRIYQLNLTAVGSQQLTFQGAAVVYNPTGLERDAVGNKISLSGNVMVNGMSCGVVYTY